MNVKQSSSSERIRNALGMVLLIIGIIISFIVFYRSNFARITDQNENYISDIASQRASLISDLFEENEKYIESAAIATETEFRVYDVDTDNLNTEREEDISEKEINKVASILREYESRFAFDYFRFIDLRGRDYTTGDKVIAANVSEREYFKRAIKGETGITYILDSKVTSERQIGFYSPVIMDEKIVGMVIGFFGEDFIERLIDISLFGHSCDVVLCGRDGTVIFNTMEGDEHDNFLEHLNEHSFTSDEDRALVVDAFRAGKDTIYNYEESGRDSVGYVSYIGDASGMFLILNFPVESYQGMISKSSRNGAVLLISLIALFAIAGAYYLIRFFRQRKRLIEESKNSNDIHFAMSRLFENFVIVDAASRIYHYIEGMPDVGHIPNDGAYDLFANDLLDRFPDSNERAEAEKLISFSHLTEEMNKGANIISYNLHAPIRDEEWFTYNFIVVSRDEEGKVSEFIIARQDITTLQEKEEETKRILANARDEAEKGNRAKSDFLSSMSHDIRTPMNAIIGYTNIAREHMDDRHMVSEALSRIDSSSHYLLSLINDVLDMSKIESGKVQIHEKECDIRQIFERIADLTRAQAEKKKHNITFDFSGVKHPHVIADELRLEQVLTNITSNAVKYTPKGGNISISCREEDVGPGTWHRYVMSVKDNGIGMSEDYIPHIFESFSRETTSTINKIQGTGLGMAITSRLVSLMGGKITVVSSLGEGSEFIVELDLDNWEPEDMPDQIVDGNEVHLDLSGRRVLLVEDNDINAEIAMMVLSGYGIITERASNGQEGFEMARDSAARYYDAVLMDIQMPIMNGYEATKAIRALDREDLKRIPIIAMSANAYEEDIRESLNSGMNGHIAKPFEPEELAAELQRYISEQE